MKPTPPDTHVLNVAFVKQRIDTALVEFFEEHSTNARAKSTSYHELWQSLTTLSAAGGKRFRPYILLLAHQAYAPDTDIEAVLPAAVAQEVLHLAMLVHDDIIDRDDIRYGIRNVGGHYKDAYKADLQDPTEREHFASSAAILAGDLLIAHAYALLHTCNVPADKIHRAQQILTTAIVDVIGGELIDTELAFRQLGDVTALTVAEQKTASYSFVGPLAMGAQLANAPETEIAALTQFGRSLGIAYQLQDDLLGVFGSEEATGKSTSGDIREGKHTYLVEQFYRLADVEQRQQFDARFGRHDSSDDDVARVRELFIQSGALAATETAIDTYAAQARHTVTTLAISEQSRGAFNTLIDRCIHRSK